MDKVLLIILMFLIAGMIIAITREPQIWGLFYAMMGGSIFIILYDSMKKRKEQQQKRRERRKKK